jgi:hypothetical protein
MYDQIAKERQIEHGNTAPGKPKTLVEKIPQLTPAPKSRDMAAAAVGTNGKYVSGARAREGGMG